jgi:hypothetical protein
MLEQYARMFDRLWRRHGSPTLEIIPPISSWTLASGVVYNSQYDQFVNGSGVVQSVSYTTAATATEVAFLPGRRHNDVAMTIGGMLTTADTGRSVVVKWTSAVQTKISVAWGVVIGSTLYRVKAWEVHPEGIDEPIEIRLELDKAE